MWALATCCAASPPLETAKRPFLATTMCATAVFPPPSRSCFSSRSALPNTCPLLDSRPHVDVPPPPFMVSTPSNARLSIGYSNDSPCLPALDAPLGSAALRLTPRNQGLAMLGIVFVRRLREGKSYDDFHEAWFPDVGFGVPARVLSGPNPNDPRDIVTVGFIDTRPDQFEDLGARLAEAEATRHDRIVHVIESTEIRMVFDIRGDDDFSNVPCPVPRDRKGFPWSEGTRHGR